MLIPLTDAEGRETWINPIHVKLIRPRGKILGMGGKGCELWMSTSATSWSINFSEDSAEIAQLVNAAMPSGDFGGVIDEDDSSPAAEG